jgi:hypothetical protein
MKWEIHFLPQHKDRIRVIELILQEENISYRLIQDNMTYKLNKGRGPVAILHYGKYIGYDYRELVNYLNKEGLMLC